MAPKIFLRLGIRLASSMLRTICVIRHLFYLVAKIRYIAEKSKKNRGKVAAGIKKAHPERAVLWEAG
jgi:hypothetical protein